MEGERWYIITLHCVHVENLQRIGKLKKLKINQALIPQMQDDAQLVAVTYVCMSRDGYYVVKQLASFEILSATKTIPPFEQKIRS